MGCAGYCSRCSVQQYGLVVHELTQQGQAQDLHASEALLCLAFEPRAPELWLLEPGPAWLLGTATAAEAAWCCPHDLLDHLSGRPTVTPA